MCNIVCLDLEVHNILLFQDVVVIDVLQGLLCTRKGQPIHSCTDGLLFQPQLQSKSFFASRVGLSPAALLLICVLTRMREMAGPVERFDRSFSNIQRSQFTDLL